MRAHARRWSLLALLASLFAVEGSALASAPSTAVDVVKIISFDCSVCYQSETLDPPIRQAVVQQGGRFIVAPLPRVESQARERFYYALRDLGPQVEQKTRDSLFRGSQDLSYPLSDAPQVLDYLSQDLANLNLDWNAIVTEVNATPSGEAVQRAINLAFKAGAQITPTYIFVRDGVVLSTFDINSSGTNTSLSALRETVLAALKSANTKSKR
jgi:hypothetical protein